MAFSGIVAIIAVLFFLLAGLPVQWKRQGLSTGLMVRWLSDGFILLFIAVLSMSVFLLAGLMVHWFSDGLFGFLMLYAFYSPE